VVPGGNAEEVVEDVGFPVVVLLAADVSVDALVGKFCGVVLAGKLCIVVDEMELGGPCAIHPSTPIASVFPLASQP
jgi:hypothetical protein